MAVIRTLLAAVGLAPKQCRAVRVGRSDGVSHRCVEDEHWRVSASVHRHHQPGGPDVLWGFDELDPNPYARP